VKKEEKEKGRNGEKEKKGGKQRKMALKPRRVLGKVNVKGIECKNIPTI